MATSKELAKFAAGACTWEAALHATLLATRSSPTILGLTLTPRINLIQLVAAGLSALVFAWYGWRRPALVKAKHKHDYESVI